MIDKIFKSNWAFYLLVGLVWSGLILAASQWLDEERERRQLKNNVLQNLHNLDAAVIETQRLIDVNPHLHITREDVKRFCKEAEKLNPGWKCPDMSFLKSNIQHYHHEE